MAPCAGERPEESGPSNDALLLHGLKLVSGSLQLITLQSPENRGYRRACCHDMVLHVMDWVRKGLPSFDNIWKLIEDAGDCIGVGLFNGLEGRPTRPGGHFYMWDLCGTPLLAAGGCRG